MKSQQGQDYRMELQQRSNYGKIFRNRNEKVPFMIYTLIDPGRNAYEANGPHTLVEITFREDATPDDLRKMLGTRIKPDLKNLLRVMMKQGEVKSGTYPIKSTDRLPVPATFSSF